MLRKSEEYRLPSPAGRTKSVEEERAILTQPIVDEQGDIIVPFESSYALVDTQWWPRNPESTYAKELLFRGYVAKCESWMYVTLSNVLI